MTTTTARPEYLEAAFAGEVAKVRSAVEGQRNDTINSASFALGTLIPAGLPRQKAYDALVEAATSVGVPQKDARYHVTRGLDAGERQPRDIPNGFPVAAPQQTVPAPGQNGTAPFHNSAPNNGVKRNYLETRGLTDTALLESSGVTLFPDRVEVSQNGYIVRRWTDGRDRRYENDPGPKPLFHFGDTESAEVVGVTEGPFDALAAAQAGLPCVATLGSFTEQSATFLRTKKRVVLIKDADKGGDAWETKARSLLDGLDVETASMPEGCKDLAEVAEKASDPVAAVRSVLESSTDSDINVVTLSDVTREYVEWLVRLRIAKGKLALAYGDPELGKTTVLLDITARITRGHAFPDGSPSGEPRDVIWLTSEDGIADTILPRVEAAGGDLRKVHVLNTVGQGKEERLPYFPDDLPKLRRLIDRTKAAMVVLDPCEAFLSPEVNSFKSADVRRALHPIKETAEETGAAFVLVFHMNKGQGGNHLHRSLGSIAFMAAVRTALLFALDPNDEERVVMSVAKSNLGPKPQSLLYAIEEDPDYKVGKVAWKGTSDLRSADLLETRDLDTSTVKGEVKERLAELLSDGQSHTGAAIAGLLKDEFKCSDKTIGRARRELGVRTFPVHEKGRVGAVETRWQLPDKTKPKRDPEPIAEPEPERDSLAITWGATTSCTFCKSRATQAYLGDGSAICPICKKEKETNGATSD